MNHRISLLIVLLIALTSTLHAKIEFPQSLAPESSLLPLISDGCIAPLDGKAIKDLRLPTECIAALDGEKANAVLVDELPKRIVDWGSGGRLGTPWRFKNDVCNDFFINLFERIATTKINLTPHDLFHAHVIRYGGQQNEPRRIALIFHAKEYPSDLEKIKNRYQVPSERFSSGDASFKTRNFIYLSAVDNQAFKQDEKEIRLVHDVYSIKESGPCREFFAQANTVSEKKVATALTKGELAGDVNLFLPQNLKRIRYQFYPGYSLLTDSFYEDLEAYETGKTRMDRIITNYAIDNLIRKQQDRPLLYFLTGR